MRLACLPACARVCLLACSNKICDAKSERMKKACSANHETISRRASGRANHCPLFSPWLFLSWPLRDCCGGFWGVEPCLPESCPTPLARSLSFVSPYLSLSPPQISSSFPHHPLIDIFINHDIHFHQQLPQQPITSTQWPVLSRLLGKTSSSPASLQVVASCFVARLFEDCDRSSRIEQSIASRSSLMSSTC